MSIYEGLEDYTDGADGDKKEETMSDSWEEIRWTVDHLPSLSLSFSCQNS